MAKNTDPLDDLTAEWEPKLRAAFLEAVRRIIDKVSIAVVTRMLEIGDVGGAIRAVGVDATDFVLLDRAITGAFSAGGDAVASTIPAARSSDGALLRIQFDVRNPRAEAWTKERSSTLVKEIVDDQQVAIRQHLTDGLARGANPRTTSLDIVGRKNPATGQREGGVIGLTSRQEEWQRRYAGELASADPAELRKALERGLRDKRFDGAIRKAIKDGKPIPAETRAKMLSAYRDKSLKYRADTISRTETIRALGASKVEAWQQAIDKGQVQADQLTKVPVHAGDERVRADHRAVAEMNADGVPWGQPYRVPAGMAPQMHAPYDEPQCRCTEIVRVNYFKGLR